MSEAATRGSLANLLTDTWTRQARDGFLLVDPGEASIETRRSLDPDTGVEYRFRWMPHRELRGDVAELERRGILDPTRDRTRLFYDPRDEQGRHCFLCVQNVRECHPRETLIEVPLAGRTYYAGANFAWIEQNHFTLMTAEHVDQDYTPAVLEAMVDVHGATGGAFRVLFNGRGAGATIPWHLHLQITTAEFPIERMHSGVENRHPIPLFRFFPAREGRAPIDEAIGAWLGRNRQHHSVNVAVAGPAEQPVVFVILRDDRFEVAPNKGLMGGFEMVGTFVYSEPDKRADFETATFASARRALAHVAPPAGT